MAVKQVIAPGDIGSGLAIVNSKVVIDRAYFKPGVAIRRSSKIGLRVTLEAEGNEFLTLNAPLSYAWSGAGLTFGSAAAATTTISVTSPGEYTATCTVTDADGQTFVARHKLKLERVIEVMGANGDLCDLFTTLASAISWINTNDAANAALYTILIAGVTQDTANVTCNAAALQFVGNGKLASGFGLIVPSSTTVRISGYGKQRTAINSGANIGIDLSSATNATLVVDNLLILANITAIRCVSATNTVQLENVSWNTSGGAAGGGVLLFPCAGANIINCIGVSNGNCLTLAGGTLLVLGGYYTSNGGYVCVDIQGTQANHLALVTGITAYISPGAATAFQFAALALSQSASGLIIVEGCSATNRRTSSALLSSAIQILANSVGSTIHLANCRALHEGTTATSLALVRFNGAGIARIYNNDLQSNGVNAAGSYGAASITPAAWNPAQFNHNILRGALNAITPDAGTVLAGGNLQIT